MEFRRFERTAGIKSPCASLRTHGSVACVLLSVAMNPIAFVGVFTSVESGPILCPFS